MNFFAALIIVFSLFAFVIATVWAGRHALTTLNEIVEFFRKKDTVSGVIHSATFLIILGVYLLFGYIAGNAINVVFLGGTVSLPA